MSSTLRIAAAVTSQTPLDWRGNEERIVRLLKTARKQGVDVVCFPELVLTAYGCEDLFLSPAVIREAEAMLARLLPETRGLLAVLGLPVEKDGKLYNASVVACDGVLCGVHPKKALPREGVHYEPRWFTPARRLWNDSVHLCGSVVPFGDFRYDAGDFSFAIELCEEAWGRGLGGAAQAEAGADLILNPSASHFALGKYAVRETLVADASRANQSLYVHVNALGLEGGRLIYDGGAIFAAGGAIVARSTRFGFLDARLHAADMDLELQRAERWRNRAGREEDDAQPVPRVITIKRPTHLKKTALPVVDRIHPEARAGQWSLSTEEEFLAAEMLGLFDYWRKSRARGFALSLSGGCDSAVVAALVGHMMAAAWRELGGTELSQRVRMPELATCRDATSALPHVLATVYQASAYSGETTRAAAKAVAETVHATHAEVSIADAVNLYVQKAEAVLGRQLTWEKDDLTLQNIQARARAPFIWLLANARGALVLATGNLSEVAVGYATMDGDTAGGLAPLGGIGKSYVREWLRWAETSCTWGLGPLKALHAVNVQAPTAELRHPSAAQTDEGDLMPYVVLDEIERLFVEEKKAPRDIPAFLAKRFPERGLDQLTTDTERFFRLFQAGQWKRERYAPSFHLGRHSLDPKGWWRAPILSGDVW